MILLPRAYYGPRKIPLLRKSHVLVARSWPGTTVSIGGKQMYPTPVRRKNNPHLREDGDRDLPSTLTRD